MLAKLCVAFHDKLNANLGVTMVSAKLSLSNLTYCWQGRKDNSQKERFFEWVKLAAEDHGKSIDLGILGFCCDVGIIRNNGRAGARFGPFALRKALANLCVSANFFQDIMDLGNVLCMGDDLESQQAFLASKVKEFYAEAQSRKKLLVLGGGHETAWGHFQGLLPQIKKEQKLAIINFDAHFDLRPKLLDKGNSGTSFSQILDCCADHGLLSSYHCFGIEPRSNSIDLYKRAVAYNCQFIETDEAGIIFEKSRKIVQENDLIYLSICLDVFTEEQMPAVSAPSVKGLRLEQVLSTLREILRSGKVLGVDIVELSPKFDINGQGARLAAFLAAIILEDWR